TPPRSGRRHPPSRVLGRVTTAVFRRSLPVPSPRSAPVAVTGGHLTKGALMTKLVRTTLFAVVLAALVAATAHAQRTVNLVGWAIGPDDPAIHRAENLEAAVDLMNAALEERGADYRVAIETDFETVSWDDYRRRILLGFESGQAPDIIISSHIDIGTWADAGYIAPLDDYIDRYEAFGDIADSLWDFVTYKGSVWGVPLNPEARPSYFNRKLFPERGWSDEIGRAHV